MKISDVERLTGLTAKTIRYYERKGLVKVGRSENAYREYTQENVERLGKIKLMRELGIAVADIRLWCDEVVDTEVLIKRRQKELSDIDKMNSFRKDLCRAILGERAAEAAEKTLFSEPDELTEDGGVQADPPLALGIDIGTSSLSAQLVDITTGVPLHTYAFDHEADIVTVAGNDAFAQNAAILCEKAQSLCSSIVRAFPSVVSIGITGQMHGIICLDADGKILSPLYTWQNRFGIRSADGVSVCEEIEDLCGEWIPSGYGMNTLYALKKFGFLPENTVKITTVMDLAVMRLCGTNETLLHPTNAASLGLYDIGSASFDGEKARRLGIDPAALPRVIGDYTIAGEFEGIAVACAIGDNQAGVFGSLSDDGGMLINIGTSGQVSVVIGENDEPAGGEIRPYFGKKRLCSGSILCGGKAYAAFADFIYTAVTGLGLGTSKNEIYKYLGEITAQSRTGQGGHTDGVTVCTEFSGTRADDTRRGHISNITLANFTPAQFARGILFGIADEMFALYKSMGDGGKKASFAAASGNAMRKNAALREIVSQRFAVPLFLPRHTEEAAYGAALYGAISADKLTEEQAKSLIKYE